MGSSMIPYLKKSLTLDEQLDLLVKRGLLVTDAGRAKNYLDRIGYYRLSAYWHVLRKKHALEDQSSNFDIVDVEDDFVDRAEFSHVIDLYVFDKKLRLLVLDAIERIEVAIRCSVIQVLAVHNRWAHLQPKFLHGNFTKKTRTDVGKTEHQIWIEKLEKSIRTSREIFVKHFRDKYSDPLPIWVAGELWDFGSLTTLYRGMTMKDKEEISLKYNIARVKLLESWLKSINHVRNICAHHSRLWNRALVDYPTLPKIGEIDNLDHLHRVDVGQTRIYTALSIIKYLLDIINPTSTWGSRLVMHVATLPNAPNVTLHDMGFPIGWEQQPLWSTTATPL